MPETLERYQLPADVQERLDELRDLSKKAEAGDKDARKELKRAVRESAPDMMREEIAGEGATPLEILLTEQVVSCWLWITLLDALNSAQFQRKLPEGAKRAEPFYLRHMVKLQESAHRRFLSSVQALARVRKLQAKKPEIQVNTQITLCSD